MSIPRTPPFRHAYRKPARRTFAVAGTAAAAAALVAVGLATATPGSPGATSALGTALTAHGGTGTLPLAQISLDRRGAGPERAVPPPRSWPQASQ